ncbi:hypothetical protein C5Q97_05515 [Victivallales bacterium CCUG 44730]|nr:hypothetical protein C5Q97_05515 [Victivallales bacterium CCUG 44730]HBP05655.1 hypothetical protein [Lentisphaeria bacterium]
MFRKKVTFATTWRKIEFTFGRNNYCNLRDTLPRETHTVIAPTLQSGNLLHQFFIMEITAIQIHKPHSDIMCKHVSEFTAENGQRLLTINRTTLRRNIFDTIIHSSVKPSTIIALIDEKLVMERHTCRIMAKIPILTHRASFIRMWCTKDINTFQVEQPGYCAMISFNTPLC